MSITIKSLGYGKVAVLQNGKHIKTFTGMSAPNDARMWVANQYKSSQPDTSTGSVAKNENVHHTAAEIYRKMQEGNLKGNQEKIDANKNGKIDSEDFKILRSKKKDTCEAVKEPGKIRAPKKFSDRVGGDRAALDAKYDKQNEEFEIDEAIDQGPKGRVKTDDIKYGQSRNATGYTATKAELAKRKEAEAAARAKPEKAPREQKLPKALDSSSRSLHRTLEDHLGGKFEHYESEPRHGHVTLPDGRKAAVMDATVTHSYTHEDLGMSPSEMPDTSETYPVRVIKHPDHGMIVHHRPHRLGESVELDEGLRLVSKHGDGQHTAKVYKDNEWEEYRVKFFKDGKHVGEDGDYHTTDLDDAKSTADSQIKRYNAKNEDTQSELGSHPDGYKKVGQRWKKAQKQDQQGKPEKSYEYADKPATGLTKEGLSFANMDFDGEIIAEEFDIELDEDNTSYEACLEIVKEQYGIESLRELDSEIADEFFESVEMLHNDIHAIAETYTRHEVEQRVFQHKKAGRKVSDVRYSIKQGQPYAEYTVTEPDGVQRKYIYHGNITKHERLN